MRTELMFSKAKVVLLAAGILALAGCAGQTSRSPQLEIFPDMDRQGKYKAQSASSLFSDGRAMRPPVEGTVAVGLLKEDEAFHTGKTGSMYVGRNPREVTRELLNRGQERFNIYCAPCHDRVGTGQGLVPQRTNGAWQPTNLHEDRVLQMPDGEIFDIVTNGRRTMKPYRFQVNENDRWAIIAYVRALQRADLGKLEDVPAELQKDLK
ncbi:MAG: cytochrome c [Acidobacteria bacterium]|nr:cytochrome c [Acidobacteriota bacterium]